MTPETLIRNAYFMPGSAADVARQMTHLGVEVTEEEVLAAWESLAMLDPRFGQSRPEFGFSAQKTDIITLAERLFA